MSAEELRKIECNIKSLKAQLSGKRDTLVAIAPEEKIRIKQQIENLQEEIREFEQQKREVIDEMTAGLPTTDREAEPIIAEIITEVEAIALQRPDNVSTAMLNLLQQILAKLNEADTPAAAKLKAAITTIPPFVSLTYEAEVDTEKVFERYFPTFNRLLQGVKEKVKK